jgi:hypothetical protein
MRNTPIDAIRVGRGVSGTWGMRERPRLRRQGPIGASCMSESCETARGPPSGGAAGSGACIARQSRPIAPTLPCYACHACVARHGLLGSAPLSCCACPPPPRPVPGTTAPALSRPPFPFTRSQPFKGALPPGTDARRNGPMDAERSEAPKPRHSASSTARVSGDRCHTGPNVYSARGGGRVRRHRGGRARRYRGLTGARGSKSATLTLRF